MASGSRSVWRTVMRGLSELYGSWNTIWMRRRRRRSGPAASEKTSTPSSWNEPELGSVRRNNVRATVVFPEPDSPTRPSVVPAGIVKRHPVHRAHRGARTPSPSQVRSPG